MGGGLLTAEHHDDCSRLRYLKTRVFRPLAERFGRCPAARLSIGVPHQGHSAKSARNEPEPALWHAGGGAQSQGTGHAVRSTVNTLLSAAGSESFRSFSSPFVSLPDGGVRQFAAT